jgi:hypothetical protein
VDVDDEVAGGRASNTKRAVVVHVPPEAPELTPRLAAVLLRVLRKATNERSLDESPTSDSDEALRSRGSCSVSRSTEE